jgi:hypothetical protein
MIHIELQPDVEAQLAAQAQARGIALERYIAETLSDATRSAVPASRSVAEAVDRIRQMRKGNRLNGLRIVDLVGEGRRF